MEEFINHLKSLEVHFQENKIENLIESLNLKEFSEKITICSKVVSEESTKLCLACRDDVSIKNELLTPLILRLKSAIDSFVSAYISIPKFYGKLANIYFKETAFSILKNLQEVIASLQKCDGSYKSALGHLWSEVDNFVLVKKTNASIIFLKLNESNKLLNDAIIELHHEIQENSSTNDVDFDEPNDEDDFEMKWNDGEIIIVNAVYGILKTVQATCTKLIKVVSSIDEENSFTPAFTNNSNYSFSMHHSQNTFEANVATNLDEICGYVVELSGYIDEVISNLYAPIEKDVLHQQVKQLRDIINEILSKGRSCEFMNAEDIKRIDFLEKALEHNFKKFVTSINQ